ncbi:hypothetical protein [Mycobacterium sp. C31M]
MNEGRKRRQAKQARRDTRRRAQRPEPVADVGEPAALPTLVDILRIALDAEHPLNLLYLGGMMIETLLPQEFSYPKDEERIDPEYAIDTLAGLPIPEHTALLAVLAEIAVGDPNIQARCREALAARSDAPPQWIIDLPKLQPYRAVRVPEVHGDWNQVLFGVRLSDGHELTCSVVIDHMGLSTVDELAVAPTALDEILERRDGCGGNVDVVDMSLADARAWIEKGFERYLPFGRDGEPGIRPLVEWLTSRLPEGGEHFQRGEHDWRVSAEVVDAFFASPAGTRFDRGEFGDVLDELIETGTGDPLRWSARRIKYSLSDGIFVGYDQERELEAQLRIPALLRAFVPVAHSRSGIGDDLTAQTLSAIDDVQKSIEDRVRGSFREYWDIAG